MGEERSSKVAICQQKEKMSLVERAGFVYLSPQGVNWAKKTIALTWFVAAPNCCHRPLSTFGITPFKYPGDSCSSADTMMHKPELVRKKSGLERCQMETIAI